MCVTNTALHLWITSRFYRLTRFIFYICLGWFVARLTLNLIEETVIDLVNGGWWFSQSYQKICSANHILILALPLYLVSIFLYQVIPSLSVCFDSGTDHHFHLLKQHLLILLIDSSILDIKGHIERFTLFCISAHVGILTLVIDLFLSFGKGQPRESFPEFWNLFTMVFVAESLRIGGAY